MSCDLTMEHAVCHVTQELAWLDYLPGPSNFYENEVIGSTTEAL